MAEADERYVLNEEALDQLYAWIDQIPLSRPKRNIARDFSDGVLVAETVAHFIPKMVEIHNYIAANGAGQKKVNWNTLNRRVFNKLGIKINDTTIQHLIDAKAGAIEQVLWDLHQKLRENNNNGPLPRSVPSRAKTPIPVNCSKSVIGSSTPAAKVASGIQASSGYEPESSSQSPTSRTSSIVGSGSQQSQGQGYVVNPVTAIVDEPISHNQSTGPPAQIIYRGHKMIPLGFLDEKDREIKSLESTNKNMNVKVHRLETLINVKDQRIEDLTHQLHSLRAMYERVTKQTYDGFMS